MELDRWPVAAEYVMMDNWGPMADRVFHRLEIDPKRLVNLSEILCLWSIDLCRLKWFWPGAEVAQVSWSSREYSACNGEMVGDVEYSEVCV